MIDKEEINMRLSQMICELTVGYRNIHILHWNMKGKNFISVHKYFNKLYDGLKNINFTDDEIEKVFYKNVLRVFSETL